MENNQDNGEEQVEYYNQIGEEGEEGEEYGENEGDNNGEEMNFEDENGEEQAEERDSLHKTLTQNIGEDVMQIAEHPNQVYYDEEVFCDYKP